MALHDVDRDSDDRSMPVPNRHDVTNIDERMAHNTLGTSRQTTDIDLQPRVVFKNAMILTYDSNGLVSSVYGYVNGVGTTPVFIIAQAGYDVFTDILGITPPTV